MLDSSSSERSLQSFTENVLNCLPAFLSIHGVSIVEDSSMERDRGGVKCQRNGTGHRSLSKLAQQTTDGQVTDKCPKLPKDVKGLFTKAQVYLIIPYQILLHSTRNPFSTK